MRARQRGRWNKQTIETPAFPIQPEGYDAKAADARPSDAKASDAQAKKSA